MVHIYIYIYFFLHPILCTLILFYLPFSNLSFSRIIKQAAFVHILMHNYCLFVELKIKKKHKMWPVQRLWHILYHCPKKNMYLRFCRFLFFCIIWKRQLPYTLCKHFKMNDAIEMLQNDLNSSLLTLTCIRG